MLPAAPEETHYLRVMTLTAAQLLLSRPHRRKHCGAPNVEGEECMIDRRRVLVGAAAVFSTMPAILRANERCPSFLFIMADDMGWADIGCYGRDDVATPHLDALAGDGMKFNHAYSNSPICSPTRVGLITGRYQYRVRVGLDEPLGRNPVGLEPGTSTFPRQLKDAGYQTSLVGKWHMGMEERNSPLRHGYDRFWGIRGGGVDYFTHDIRLGSGGASATGATADLWDGDTRVETTGYFTDVLGDRAAREIVRMSRDSRPFLLSLHFTAPHWPWEAPGDEEAARNLANAMHFDGGNIATYRRMIESLDRNVGRVLAALKASGRADDTVVVFTSDNGGERFAKNWPFNGMKGEVLEGGIRTPLLVRWPGRVPRGTTSEQMAISMDWVPTFLEAAGVSADARAPTDGISLMPALRESRAVERDLYWRFKANSQAALRRGPWKYLRINSTEYLFDVVADPQERGNLRNRYPDRFASLKADWDRWNSGMLPYTDDTTSWSNKEQKTLVDRY
jgi:arylsulfatase A-like enzyme